jgi:beta-1,2-mannobiose phosphorylase / 1,2-beta-oligomannan phosphorylase
MLRRLFNSCLLRPIDLPPSSEDMEVIGTFNPGAVATNDGVVILVRVAERPIERRSGFTALPYWDLESGRASAEWVCDSDLMPLDVRVVQRKSDGLVRLTFISHLRVIRSRDGRSIDSIAGARFDPLSTFEEFGVEDPRITPVNGIFYFTYVAVSRHGVATALASTKDFTSFERHGIIFPPENKDVLLFPEKVGGQYRALHRPNGATPFTRPEIWTASSPDLKNWGSHEPLLSGEEEWALGRIGGGVPPLRTEQGWLELYHGNNRRVASVGIGTYCAGALLLDLGNPGRVVGRSGVIMAPETEFERNGFVPNVVFPTGAVELEDTLLVYYGAADTNMGVVEFSRRELLDAINEADH